MDLTDILRKRAEIDLAVATARSLELSLEIDFVSKELISLRKKLGDLENRVVSEVSRDDVSFETPPAIISSPIAEDLPANRSAQKPLYQRLLRKLASRPAEQPQFHWHLDEIAGTFPVRDKTGINAVVSSTSFPALTLSGWIVPMGDNPAFAAIEIMLVGSRGRIAKETQTYQRPDVAAHFGNPGLSSCGFRMEIPMFEIPAGHYAMKISGRALDGTTMAVPAGSITIS